MSDYKNTLNLPYTDFPMKANLAQKEPAILKKWQTENLYEALREKTRGQTKFILHLGPPYANGHIHMGTAFTTVLKDIIVKSKTMSGYDAPLVPGWDCHGLPIELNVEKKIGKPGQTTSVAEFQQACRKYAEEFINIQREEFKRLGIQADWEHPYLTMNYTFEANTIRALKEIMKHGHLQQGFKPVYWCLECASALAEAEVEYADKVSAAIDVAFNIIDNNAFLARFEKNITIKKDLNIAIAIWTTTPWTLPANEAVALNAEADYVLVECKNQDYLLVAEALLPEMMHRYSIQEYRVLASISGQKLEGIQLQHPFYSRSVPVVLGDHVTMDSGTGAVHIAPAHGQEDYIVGKQYQLPVINPVGDDGCFVSTTPLFAGMHVNKVNDKIIQTLKEKSTLLHLTQLTHSYPHCWRHKTPLIFRATPQWFISMDQNQLRKKALDAIDHTQWVPSATKNRIYSMVQTRPDWCISRQRTWGVPIPLFLHKETNQPHPDSIELMEKVAERVATDGTDAWLALDATELLGEDAINYKKCRDILDVWFDSGVTHYCVLKQRPELTLPADLYLEGSDQHRGWFNSSLVTSIAINNHAPYKTVLTHGYVVDGQGRKMSKSLGNVMAPEKVIQSLGADVLRLWVSSMDYRSEIHVSDEILTRTSETYRRLRNTARFLLANLHGFDPVEHLVAPDQMLALDRWAVSRANIVQNEIIKAFDAYQFHVIYQKIHHFCTIEMGSFYLDIIKDRQYTTQTNSLARRSCQTALFHIIEALTRWIAPILSFTAEEIWQFIPGKREKSVFLSTWYTALAGVSTHDLMNQHYWEKLRLIRNAVNKEIENLRNAGKIGSGLEANVQLYCSPELKTELDALENELRFVLITSYAEVYSADQSDLDIITVPEVVGLSLKVTPVTYLKCERCWHRRQDVAAASNHVTLCGRCVENVEGTGEVRKYA